MGFINSRVASVISLGGACFSLSSIPCSQVIAVEKNIDIDKNYKTNKDLSDTFEGKSGNLNDNGKENFEKIKDWLSRYGQCKVLDELLNRLNEEGSLRFSEIINKVEGDGTGNLYLILSKISVADKDDSKCSAVSKFAEFLCYLGGAGAKNFALMLGGKLSSIYGLLNVFGVSNLLCIVLEELDERSLPNFMVLLNKMGGNAVLVFPKFLNSLSKIGISNFSNIFDSCEENQILYLAGLLGVVKLDVKKLAEKFNDKKFDGSAFLYLHLDPSVNNFISELGLKKVSTKREVKFCQPQ